MPTVVIADDSSTARMVIQRSFVLDLPQTGAGGIPRLPCPNRVIKFLIGRHYLFVAVPEAFWNPEVWK